MLINFDFDGVFVDTFDAWLGKVQAAQRIVGSGRCPTREDFATVESFTFDAVARQCGIAVDDLPRFVAEVYALQERDGELPAVYPDMPKVVRAIAREHAVAIVTASLRAAVEPVLEEHDLRDSVAAILDSRDPGAKSDKIAALRARFGCAPEQTFMIGDAISDIRQGKKAGVRTIAAAWGFQRRDLLLAEEPDFVAERPIDLLTLI